MQTNLLSWLVANTSPETVELFKRADDVFDNIGIEDHEAQYDDLIYGTDYMEPTDQMEGLNTYTSDVLESILKQHGVYVDEETDLEHLLLACEALLNLQKLQDATYAVDICENKEMDNLEKIAEIFAYVTAHKPEEFMTYITEVSDSLFSAIIINLKNKAEDIDDILREQKSISDVKIRKIDKLYEDCAESFLYDLIKAGLRCNMEFDYYIELYGQQLLEMPVLEIARNLIGITIISNASEGSYNQLIDPFLSKNFIDLKELGQVQTQVRDFFIKINQEPNLKIS